MATKFFFVALMMFSCFSYDVTGAKILALFPLSAKSHNNVFSALTTSLAEKGHEVTVVTAFPIKKQLPNYREIHMDVIQERMETLDSLSMKNLSIPQVFSKMFGIAFDMCDIGLASPEIQKLIVSNQKFDLVILSVFLNDCYLGFAHKYDAPLVMISPGGVFGWMNDFVGNPDHYSYIPAIVLPFPGRMSFVQRLVNTVVSAGIKVARNHLYLPVQERTARRYFGESLPSLLEIERNASLVLVNSHLSMSQPRPYVPNMVEVGGMHIKPAKALPPDLKKFLDDAKEGVIYFSLGSHVKSNALPTDKRQIFLDVFSKLPNKVLWKWESDSLPGQPKNVKIGKWLPQNDLLAHPNIRVFITHGGLLSSQEAIYHGVPLVGIPLFGDQAVNMNEVVMAGIGVQLDLNTLTRSNLEEALLEVLQTPSYRENVKRRSAIFKDQPETPLERAVFWTEYIIRHRGARHLRSAAMDLSWYQYFLLDVIAVLALALAVVLGGLYLVVRTVYRLLRRKRGKSKKE